MTSDLKLPRTGLSGLLSCLGLTLLLLLLALSTPEVEGTCRFPEFLQREPPWAASYKNEDRLVIYVKGTHMQISQRGTMHTRKCERRAQDNKFLVSIVEKDMRKPQYMCMQFLERSANIVQVKVSPVSDQQSLELCEEDKMALDRWPIVQMTQTPDQKINCPFIGGFNVDMYYPNDTHACPGSPLLMRIESECERGEGIVFDFREQQCVPRNLPRGTVQRAHCIAHWTQGSQTFIILQHAEIHKHTWCLRISDPLTDIHGAHLMLDLVCDTSDQISETTNYFRLVLTKRVYASTCEDLIETDVCNDVTHLCGTTYNRNCARTCEACTLESAMMPCTFQEAYRGQWMDSGKGEDKAVTVESYSLTIAGLGRYDCLLMESDKHETKRVLVHIDEHGCYPRYACVEMTKIESSVMRFRLGERHQWPLPPSDDPKDLVCAKENFVFKDMLESRYHMEKPARLVIREPPIFRVPCGLPEKLQGGIAFREEGGRCSGCLMFRPGMSNDRFVIRPYNCTDQPSAALPQHRMTTLEYSCLASFTFRNSTHAVVTKTSTYSSLGQYLVWVFTPTNNILVAKAGETLRFHQNELDPIPPEMLEAQFTIQPSESEERCGNVISIGTVPSNNRDTTRRPVFPGEIPNFGGPGGPDEPYPPRQTSPRLDEGRPGVKYNISDRSTRRPVTQINSPGTSGESRAEENSGGSSSVRTMVGATAVLSVCAWIVVSVIAV